LDPLDIWYHLGKHRDKSTLCTAAQNTTYFLERSINQIQELSNPCPTVALVIYHGACKFVWLWARTWTIACPRKMNGRLSVLWRRICHDWTVAAPLYSRPRNSDVCLTKQILKRTVQNTVNTLSECRDSPSNSLIGLHQLFFRNENGKSGYISTRLWWRGTRHLY